MNETMFTAPLRIGADHPALPGHFPGQPIVPGVVLLRCVADALKQWRNQSMSRFDVKFLSPLLPEQDAEIELHAEAARVRFAIRRGNVLLARGVMEAQA
jgi:3-hydroxyacyl-[acyl-carrier-protein] dehydratase